MNVFTGAKVLRLAAVLVAAALLVGSCSTGSTGSGSPGPVRARPAAGTELARAHPQQHAGAARTTAARTPAAAPTTPCTANRRNRYVFVSIRRQHMWMCTGHRVAYATPITSGMVGQYTETPTGTFQIQGRNRNTTLTLNTGATYPVKYWIPFQAPLFGFHDSSWQRFPYGSPRYRTQGSHGCVHMPLAAIRFLYGWADIGTTVRIHH